MRGIQSRAGYYKIEVEPVGTDTTFLDLFMHFQNGRIVTARHFKKTSFTIPPSTTSAHPRAVHRSWPMSMSHHRSCLSTSDEIARDAISGLKKRFRSNLTDDFTIQMLSQTQTCIVPCTDDDMQIVWLKLGYHPASHSHIARAIRQFVQTHRGLLSLIFPNLRVRIAWRNALP